MTVRWFEEGECYCEWFVNNNQDLKGDKFLADSLTKTNPKKKAVPNISGI